MSIPDIVQSALGDEPAAARVALGGEDELFVTPTRTLLYRAEGLLSDESVDAFPHDAERVAVSEGRRKSKVTLDYGLDGEETFALPTSRLDDALHPVLAGVLNAAGITDPGETVSHTFRFSELTLVITSRRLVKHVGAAVWDDDYEEFHYDDVTDLTFEEGNVATSVVLGIDGRQERLKIPNDVARAVREGLTAAVLDHFEVSTLDEFRRLAAPEESEQAEADEETVSFGDGPTPLSATPSDSAEATDGSRGGDAGILERIDTTADATQSPAGGDTESQTAATAATGDADSDVAAELQALRERVDAQGDQLRRQNELIETLIQELRQGR